MTTEHMISIEDLWLSIGTAACPAVIDARTDEDFAADPRLIPGAIRRLGLAAATWAGAFAGRDAIVVCERGLKISQGAAGWLRHAGSDGRALSGGFQAWRTAGLPLVAQDRIPPRDGEGRTVWVGAAVPGPQAVACPWLVRRFVDPDAVFLFVEASQVAAVADRFGAAPFAAAGTTFADLADRFGLATAPFARLTAIVDGPAPETAGLAAAAEGLHGLSLDEPARLEAAMTLCDAFYVWCRDATEKGLQ